MKRVSAILLFIILNLLVTNISTQADDSTDQKNEFPGMEIISVGNGQKLILPKGTKMRRVGAQLILEDNAEYVATRIWNLEKRVEELEIANEELKKQIQELKNPTP